MRILILGAAGMLGHRLFRGLSKPPIGPGLEVWGAVRSRPDTPRARRLLPTERLLVGVDVRVPDLVIGALAACRPEVVVNAVGVIKQLPGATDPILSLEINSLLPHRLHRLCQAAGARLVHISTDCVFAGTRGGYTESDPPDATDLYGRSKLLGEVDAPGAVTLRTSIIGRELGTRHGLLEWFLSNRGGRVKGYRAARFSGLTTGALTEVIARLITEQPQLSGLYQVAAAPIDKYELLCRLKDALGVAIEVEPDDTLRIDRTLDASRFQAATGLVPPTWEALIAGLALEAPEYEAADG